MNLIRFSHPRTTSFVSASGRSPWHGLESEFDRLFDTALSDFANPSHQHRFPVDVYEDKDSTYVRAELPGLTKEDIGVELINGYLSITGQRDTTNDEGKTTETFSMNRSVHIPEEVQVDKIAASLENGILTVTLPKREETKPKKISVQIK